MYSFLKTIHLLGITLFFGNVIVTGVWKFFADKTKDPVIIAYSQRLVTITDFLFTTIGATMLTVSGIYLIFEQGYNVLEETWLLTSIIMLGISTLLWLVVLIPIQIKLAKLTKTFNPETTIPIKYWKLQYIWYWVGGIGTLLPLFNYYLMVYKPS
jgi:uncharacterized membrane protein